MMLAKKPETHRIRFQSTWQILEEKHPGVVRLGSPFLPLLLLWSIPHQLHKMHFHIKRSPLTLSERLTREEQQRDFLGNFPQG